MSPSRPFRFDVVGDGFDREACERLVTQLGLTDTVHFHGRLARQDVDRFYRDADVFVFPSYREPGGNVVLEAMAHSLALIVCDRGGPGAAVTENCAIKVPAQDPDQFVRDLSTAIARLIDDGELRRRLAVAARAHVTATALWDTKIDRATELYRELVVEHRRG